MDQTQSYQQFLFFIYHLQKNVKGYFCNKLEMRSPFVKEQISQDYNVRPTRSCNPTVRILSLSSLSLAIIYICKFTILYNIYIDILSFWLSTFYFSLSISLSELPLLNQPFNKHQTKRNPLLKIFHFTIYNIFYMNIHTLYISKFFFFGF